MEISEVIKKSIEDAKKKIPDGSFVCVVIPEVAVQIKTRRGTVVTLSSGNIVIGEDGNVDFEETKKQVGTKK